MANFKCPTIGSAIAALLVSLGSVPVAAQDEMTDPDGNVIVVEGELPDGGVAARQQARDITQRLGTTNEPLARFRAPVCAGTFGLLPQNASAVIDRIYDNAERIGLVVDDTPDCAANVWVIIVDDPAQTFSQLRDDNSWMLDGLGRSERNKVERQQGPVRAWTAASTRTVDGRPIPTGFQAAAASMAGAASGGAAGGTPIATTWNMSRLNSAIRRDIDLAVVLIGRSSLGDFDAYAIADYATMRALARTEEPSRELSYDTVLTMFSDDLAPRRMSTFDIAYLRATYFGPGNRNGLYPLSRLDNYMVETALGGN